jgi:hypothetical protein
MVVQSGSARSGGSPFEQSTIGIDSFQALFSALRLLCVHLDRYAEGLTFLDGRLGYPETPLIVPWNFAASQKAEVSRLIDSKIEEILNSRRS